MRFRLIAAALFTSLITLGAFAAPTAIVTLPNATQHVLLGTDVTFCVRFANTGNAVGYGPFIDLLLDRAGGGTTAPLCDGLSYVSAQLVHTNPPLPLNAVATPQVAPPCGPAGTFNHPWGFPPAPSTTGQEFVRIELPFGSFQNGEAPLDIEIKAHVHPQADVGSPLIAQVRGGYRWGGPFFSPWVPQTVIPEVVTIDKTFLGPENETVSGPNFPGKYGIEINVAPGQTIANAVLQDCAPNGVVFQTSGSNCFTQQWPSLSGQQTLTPQFAILQPPAVALPACFNNVKNRAELIGGLWTPSPPSIPPDPPIDFATMTPPRPFGEVTIKERTIAIQKRVTSGSPVPGGILGYQLDFQVSDYYRFGNIVVRDVLSDGQALLGPVSVSVTDRFGSKSVSLPPIPLTCITTTANVAATYICPPGAKEPCTAAGSQTTVAMTGGTQLRVDVSCIMRSVPFNNPFRNGVLTGGQVPSPGGIAATGRINFSVAVKDSFANPHPPGDKYLDKHDPVLNAAFIQATLASNANVINPPLTGPTCGDDTYSCLAVPDGPFEKIVYAKNQVILNPLPGPVTTPLPQFSVTDTITFRLRKTIPTGDAEDVRITDWFPLPLLSVPLVPPLTTLQPCAGSQPVPPTPIAVACYAASWAVPPPTMAPVAPNGLTFNFGTFNNTANTSRTLEIYITIAVSNDPRPDGLYLTNHAQECERNTFGTQFCQTAIAQFELTEPLLRIGKAIICPDPACPDANPGPAPSHPPIFIGAPGEPVSIDPNAGIPPKWNCAQSNACPRFSGKITGITTPLLANTAANVDANDEVTFAVVVENHGNGPYGAHYVQIGDVLSGLPASFVAGSLCIVHGDGSPVLFTPGTGPGGFPVTLNTPLLSPSAGAGQNVVVLTFRVKMPPPAQAEIGRCLTNTASINFYTNTVGGSNFVTSGLVDPGVATATACIKPKVLSKSIVATSEGHTSEQPVRPVAIGEIVRYRLSLDIPEGFTNALTIADTLPAGFTYLPAPPVVYTLPPGVTMPPPGPPSVSGQTLSFAFGPILNSNDSPWCEVLGIEFPVLAGNVPANTNGQVRPNGFSASATAGPLGTFAATNDTTATIVEPHILITKDVTPATAGPGGSVSYTISVTNIGSTDAFDVGLQDVLPSTLTALSAGLPAISPAGCTAFSLPTIAGSTLTSTAPRMPPGCNATFAVHGQLPPGSCPPQVANQANVTYTSLPGPQGTLVNPTLASVPGSPGLPNGERIYTGSASATFGCTQLPECDFSIVKTGIVQPMAGLTKVTYTITASVTPPGRDCPCKPVDIRDTLPAELTNVTVGPLPAFWTQTLSGSVLTLSTTTQPPAMPATFTVTGYAFPKPVPYLVTNCVRLSCPTDPNQANNSSCTTVTIP